MIRQAPKERPSSIAKLKGLLQQYQSEAISLQRLSNIDGTVIKSEEIDNPLAFEPPRLVRVDWNKGLLTLYLDRAVDGSWISALHQMGNFISVAGKPPIQFSFSGNRATINADDYEVQQVVDYFKSWLPDASRKLKEILEQEAQRSERLYREQLSLDRQAEEQRLRILKSIRI